MAEQKSTAVIAVGDHIRLNNRVANEHASYQITNTQVAFSREPADGLVLSIRNLKTGELLAQTAGSLHDFVIEMLFDNTFNSRYASTRNAPRTAERASATPAWNRIRAWLKGTVEKGELLSTSSQKFLNDSPLAKTLDGWKVIKIFQGEVESLEAPVASEAAQN